MKYDGRRTGRTWRTLVDAVLGAMRGEDHVFHLFVTETRRDAGHAFDYMMEKILGPISGPWMDVDRTRMSVKFHRPDGSWSILMFSGPWMNVRGMRIGDVHYDHTYWNVNPGTPPDSIHRVEFDHSLRVMGASRRTRNPSIDDTISSIDDTISSIPDGWFLKSLENVHASPSRGEPLVERNWEENGYHPWSAILQNKTSRSCAYGTASTPAGAIVAAAVACKI